MTSLNVFSVIPNAGGVYTSHVTLSPGREQVKIIVSLGHATVALTVRVAVEIDKRCVSFNTCTSSIIDLALYIDFECEAKCSYSITTHTITVAIKK